MKSRHFARPDLTKVQALAALKTELASVDDARLFALTVPTLRGRYKVPEREIECTLLAAQETRRRFNAKREVVG